MGESGTWVTVRRRCEMSEQRSRAAECQALANAVHEGLQNLYAKAVAAAERATAERVSACVVAAAAEAVIARLTDMATAGESKVDAGTEVKATLADGSGVALLHAVQAREAAVGAIKIAVDRSIRRVIARADASAAITAAVGVAVRRTVLLDRYGVGLTVSAASRGAAAEAAASAVAAAVAGAPLLRWREGSTGSTAGFVVQSSTAAADESIALAARGLYANVRTDERVAAATAAASAIATAFDIALGRVMSLDSTSLQKWDSETSCVMPKYGSTLSIEALLGSNTECFVAKSTAAVAGDIAGKASLSVTETAVELGIPSPMVESATPAVASLTAIGSSDSHTSSPLAPPHGKPVAETALPQLLSPLPLPKQPDRASGRDFGTTPWVSTYARLRPCKDQHFGSAPQQLPTVTSVPTSALDAPAPCDVAPVVSCTSAVPDAELPESLQLIPIPPTTPKDSKQLVNSRRKHSCSGTSSPSRVAVAAKGDALMIRFPEAAWPPPPDFECQLRSRLDGLGAERLVEVAIRLRQGSIIADVFGPCAILAQIHKLPIAEELVVAGYRAGEVHLQLVEDCLPSASVEDRFAESLVSTSVGDAVEYPLMTVTEKSELDVIQASTLAYLERTYCKVLSRWLQEEVKEEEEEEVEGEENEEEQEEEEESLQMVEHELQPASKAETPLLMLSETVQDTPWTAPLSPVLEPRSQVLTSPSLELDKTLPREDNYNVLAALYGPAADHALSPSSGPAGGPVSPRIRPEVPLQKKPLSARPRPRPATWGCSTITRPKPPATSRPSTTSVTATARVSTQDSSKKTVLKASERPDSKADQLGLRQRFLDNLQRTREHQAESSRRQTVLQEYHWILRDMEVEKACRRRERSWQRREAKRQQQVDRCRQDLCQLTEDELNLRYGKMPLASSCAPPSTAASTSVRSGMGGLLAEDSFEPDDDAIWEKHRLKLFLRIYSDAVGRSIVRDESQHSTTSITADSVPCSQGGVWDEDPKESFMEVPSTPRACSAPSHRPGTKYVSHVRDYIKTEYSQESAPRPSSSTSRQRHTSMLATLPAGRTAWMSRDNPWCVPRKGALPPIEATVEAMLKGAPPPVNAGRSKGRKLPVSIPRAPPIFPSSMLVTPVVPQSLVGQVSRET